MIENRQVRFAKGEAFAAPQLETFVQERLGDHALRWYIAKVTADEIVVEATFDPDVRASGEAAPVPLRPGREAVVSIVPTGVGCELGGYAGDAAPATRLLAATADYLVTNPNAVNASNFIALERNVLYTEGLCIDHLMQGKSELLVPRANRVGLIVEKTSAEDLDTVFNVVNTVRAVFGVDLDVQVTDAPIGSHCIENASGAYVGTVDHPEVIIDAAAQLLARGADAIAITTNIQDLPHDEYVKHFEGQYPNPLGGVEAIISHLVVDRFHLPAAHAPMINLKELALAHPVVDARGAGEMASVSGLACVLIGLARAPRPAATGAPATSGIVDVINVGNVVAVVAPSTCLGGIPTLYAHRRGIPIIAVEANQTVLDVTAGSLGLDGVIPARSYPEAAGIILALRNGISIESVDRPLPTLRHKMRQSDRRSDHGLKLAARIA